MQPLTVCCHREHERCSPCCAQESPHQHQEPEQQGAFSLRVHGSDAQIVTFYHLHIPLVKGFIK